MPSYGETAAVGDIWQLTHVCRADDQIGLNVIHYVVTAVAGAPKASDFVAAVEALTTPRSTHYKGLMSVNAEFRGYLIQRVSPAGGVVWGDSTGAGDATVAGDMLPRQVCGLISKRAAIAGRRKGGRVYVPFPAEGDSDEDGIPTDSYQTRLENLASSFDNSLTKGGSVFATPVIGIRTTIAGVTAYTATRSIQFWIARQMWATQRRRGSFGRANATPI